MTALHLAIAAAAIAALSGVGGYRLGAERVQARWDSAELQRSRGEAAARLRQVDRTLDASTAHEAERARLASALRGARRDLQTSLQQPMACPPGQDAVPLGAVRVPSAVVDSLRRAGADYHAVP